LVQEHIQNKLKLSDLLKKTNIYQKAQAIHSLLIFNMKAKFLWNFLFFRYKISLFFSSTLVYVLYIKKKIIKNKMLNLMRILFITKKNQNKLVHKCSICKTSDSRASKNYNSHFIIINHGILWIVSIHDHNLIWLRIRVMVFNITFNNISVISWWSVLLVEETGEPGENNRQVASHCWQTLSHNVVSSIPCHEWGSNSQL